MIRKGRAAIQKLLSILGLNVPIAKTTFTVHTKKFESKALDLLNANLADAARKAKEAVAEYIEDIAVCFDGLWKQSGLGTFLVFRTINLNQNIRKN